MKNDLYNFLQSCFLFGHMLRICRDHNLNEDEIGNIHSQWIADQNGWGINQQGGMFYA